MTWPTTPTTDQPELETTDAAPEAPADGAPEAPADPLVCEICGRTFSTTQGLGRHRTVTHKQGKSTTRKKGGAKPPRSRLTTDAVMDARLLHTLYPDGNMPVTAITDIRAWLDQAHKLRG